MVVPGNDIRASRRWRAALRIGDRICRGAVRGIGRTIRFGSILDVDCILIADFISSSGGTNLSVSADGEMRVHVVAGIPPVAASPSCGPFDSRPADWPKPAGVVAISQLTGIGPTA
jgi:hypothetical protein